MADHTISPTDTGLSPIFGPPSHRLTNRLRARYGDFVVAAAEEIHASIAVRGVQGTTDLIDRVVLIADGDQARLRDLLTPSLDHGQVIDSRQLGS